MKKRLTDANFSFLLLLFFFLTACAAKKSDGLFSQLPASSSGIDFSNDIRENDSAHSFINEFGYMGGGVGIGDFNNDGLKDIFFTGNQVSCQLYINKGNNHFENITESAGLTTTVWATGVSIIDINHDGYDDIYVSVFGKNLSQRATNLLFINQHNLRFQEMAAGYGLADNGYSTQAVFLDYDRDGDLDMYLANYLLNGANANYVIPRNNSGTSPANDRLYRNNGYDAVLGHDVFSDVSMAAGIREDGYGLGLVSSDFNNDGWPDIYVANDFISNDELWLNNGHGGFANSIAKSIRHQSYSSMGADAADLNNDGLEDIVILDMAPENNTRKKQVFSPMNYERYQSERALGYEPEFSRNMLQLNMGNRDSIPLFSETAQLAGIAETDWSWSVLLADFNNDGWKDMHITNGIGRDFINGDFLEFSNNVFATTGSPQAQRKAVRNKLSALKPVSLGNYLYLSNGDYGFTDVSGQAGVAMPSLSNGAAYVDLDNDGDLDLVTNNINQPCFVLINNSRQADSASTHYIKFRLVGDRLNTRGLGAKITVYAGGILQVQEQQQVRGYFSSVDPDLVFGVHKQAMIDSITVSWPDQKMQRLYAIHADTVLTISWKEADTALQEKQELPMTLLTDITAATGINFRQQENIFNDFGLQRLLPQKYSQLGPFMAVADIDNNGSADFFVGNGIGFPGALISQDKSGHFTSMPLGDSNKLQEDLNCVFFDADADGDQDLLITCGDVQYPEGSVNYQPRLYINDGKGHFRQRSNAIPNSVANITGCMSVADYDNDGDFDLFIGGRVSKNYPVSPSSYLLQNNKGVFTDVTDGLCPALKQAGMLTGAVWVDFDKDGLQDLVIAGEWMPVRFFKNNGLVFREVTASTGLTGMAGMWRSLVAADLDNDGDMDLVAGNLGLNCVYKATALTPMQLFAADIDGNGTIDPVLFYYIKTEDGSRRSYPAISRALLAEQVPLVKKKFLRYADYARADADDIFNSKAKRGMLQLTCEQTASCWLENLGNGKFLRRQLPMAAQIAPVNAIIAADIDGDGNKDLLLAGNEYQAEVTTGRYDASYGVFLKGNADKTFVSLPLKKTGFILDGDIKSMVLVPCVTGGSCLVTAANNDSLKVFRLNLN